MARNFLGKGWRYPVMIDRNGGMAQSAFDDLVRESILIILGTAPGERVMRPYLAATSTSSCLLRTTSTPRDSRRTTSSKRWRSGSRASKTSAPTPSPTPPSRTS